MLIDTKNMVSITEANQNFSRVVRLVIENGEAYILKNNKPIIQMRYLSEEESPALSEEAVLQISDQLMDQFGKAYEALAK
jgi:antitoxin Phd